MTKVLVAWNVALTVGLLLLALAVFSFEKAATQMARKQNDFNEGVLEMMREAFHAERER